LSLLRDAKKKFNSKGENRIKEYANVLGKDRFTDDERFCAARWFHYITDRNGPSLKILNEAGESLGLSKDRSRVVVEERLLMHPGLYLIVLSNFHSGQQERVMSFWRFLLQSRRKKRPPLL